LLGVYVAPISLLIIAAWFVTKASASAAETARSCLAASRQRSTSVGH
jgi:hypothetical protein